MNPISIKNEALFDDSMIPALIKEYIALLNKAGFEGYIIGGCTRDILLQRNPKDWDITTNATPDQIQAIFPKTFYENVYGTVGVVHETIEDETLKVVEITPYRTESTYSDSRHPDEVRFSTSIDEDLKRRDFTINAIAYDPISKTFIDNFDGLKDIETKTLRTVGNPVERFTEDGLRILRAIRIAGEIGFTINIDTEKAIIENGHILEKIAKERLRDEFIKVINSDTPAISIFLMNKVGILKYIVPELEEGLHVKQNQAHSFEVFEHLLRSLQHAADKKYQFHVRLAALLHDIGKPRSRRFAEEKNDYTFYGHEVIGAKMAKSIVERLKFSRETIDLVTNLVRWHMFFSDTNQITLSAVRRMVINVGQDHIWDLINLRICDRIGTGRPKEDPYRLRKYIAMIEQVLRDPISVSMLKVDGNSIMKHLNMAPGPKLGFMLNILLEEVIENPALNTENHLLSRVTELNVLELDELKRKSEVAIQKKNMVEGEEIKGIEKKYKV